jgi:CRISPR-associated protein Cmr3
MYFFEVTSGDPAVLSECWLESVADEEQDRRDGFGLAVWGIW